MKTRDWWLAPIQLTSDNNKFRINETGSGGNGVITAEPSAGTYYQHLDRSVHVAGDYPSLYEAIKDELDVSTAANGYDWKIQTPTKSSEQYAAGIRFGDIATIEFDIEFSNAGFTMDPRWFGFAIDEGDVTAVKDSGNLWHVDSKFCSRGRWRSFTEGGDGIATRKRSHPTKEIRFSHSRARDRKAIKWFTKRVRPVSYEHVPAGHVYDRHDELGYYPAAKLGYNDTNNAFEVIWDALSDNGVAIVVWNVDTWDGDLDGHSAEAVRLMSTGQAEDFADIVRNVRVNGEYYDIDITVENVASNLPGYDY